MKKRHVIAAAAAAAIAAITLAGCTGAPAAGSGDQSSASGKVTGTITFQTWSLKNDTFTPYFNNVVKAFEKKYPGTKVNWIDQPAQGYEDKVLQQAESGELPDVINLPPNYAFTLAGSGQLADLKKTDDSALSAYTTGGVAQYKFDGLSGVYGLPWYLGTNVSYWNTDLLKKGGIDKAPTTLDDFFTDAAALAKQNIPTISSVPDPQTLWQYNPGGNPSTNFFNNGKFVFNNASNIALVEKYVKAYQQGAFSAEALQGVGTSNTNATSFVSGRIAWTTGGPNYVVNQVAVNAPTMVDTVEPVAIFGQAPLFTQGISVSAHSKNAATAQAFANYVTNNANQIAFCKLAAGFFPGTKAANKHPESFTKSSQYAQQNKATKIAAGEMNAASDTKSVPQYTTAMTTYGQQQIALAIEGKQSAKQALDNAVKYDNENIQK